MESNLTPSLRDLVASITAQVNIITEFLDSKNIPHPSFRADAPPSLPEDKEVQLARAALIEAATNLTILATGARDFTRHEVFIGKYDVYVLNALNHFRVFEHVPLEDKISYEDLAAKTGLPVSRLYQILRHAMTHRTFYEPAAGYVAHTANSAYVHKSPSSRAWIAHNVEEINHSLSFANEAIEKWGDDSDPARTGFALAFDLPPETSLWQFFQTDGEGEQKGFRARRFGQAMSSMSESTAFSNKHLHNLFDWKSLGKASVVDIGGSQGHDDIELASTYPDLQFVVQDRAELEVNFTKGLPASLSSRITFQTHDFFTPQPVKGADVYFLKHICHDWADPLSISILRQIVPAMTPWANRKGEGSRLIIVDSVMPEIGELPGSLMRLNTAMDLQMMATLNAKERTRKDWEKLLKEADSRFRVVELRKSFGAADSALEVVLDA